MLLALIAVAAGLAIGVALGGRPRRLSEVRLRALGLLVAGAVCEFAGSLWGAGWFATAVLVAGYLLLAAFATANLSVTGMVLVAVGLLSNLAVISINGGMPVRGVSPDATYGPRHHGIRPSDHLVALADQVRVAPLGETVSAGDIVLSVGVATAVAALTRPKRGMPQAAR